MGPLGSRPRCSALVYICVNMQLELELKRGFCSSNIQTLKTSTLQKSRGSRPRPLFPDFNKNREDPMASRLPKYPPNYNEAKCFQNPKSATSMLFQQWPGAFNKWGSFKCLPSFQANLYVRITNHEQPTFLFQKSAPYRFAPKAGAKKIPVGGTTVDTFPFWSKKQRIERAAKTRTSWAHALHMSGKFYFWSSS